MCSGCCTNVAVDSADCWARVTIDGSRASAASPRPTHPAAIVRIPTTQTRITSSFVDRLCSDEPQEGTRARIARMAMMMMLARLPFLGSVPAVPGGVNVFLELQREDVQHPAP